MRELVVPEVPDPESHLPRARLVAEPKCRPRDDGKTDIWVEKKDRWMDIHPIGMETFAAVRDQMEFVPMVERVAETAPEFRFAQVRALVRNYLWTFTKLGFMELDMPPAPDVFAGRYKRIRELGRGGLGIVHLCHDLQEDQQVVIKHPWGIRQDVSRGQRALANEIRVLEVMDHPVLPRLVDQFLDGGLLHLVRSFTPGKDLHEHFKGPGVPDPALRLELAVQIAQGVRHMHEQGVLFLDARPANYVLGDGRVQIIDFGNAVPHEDGKATVRGSRGSIGYTAPELRKGDASGWRDADLRTDVYAFGRVMYFFLTGATPGRRWFQADQDADVDARGITGAERELMDACTRDDADERPADMDAVLDRLRALAAQSPAPAPSVS